MVLIVRSVLGSSRKKLGKVGLTIPQAWLLSQVGLHGPLTPSDLARRSQLSRQAVTTAVRSLADRGLVRRTRSEADRRTLQLALTPKADRLFARMLPEVHTVHRRIESLFDPAERETLVPLLARIAVEFGLAEELELLRCPYCTADLAAPAAAR